MPRFDLQAIQRKVDANPIVPPVVLRPEKPEKPKPEFNLSIAEKEIAKLKELFE